MDISIEKRSDWESRRKIRLAQVRDQSKTIAKTIRDRVHRGVKTQLEQRETVRNKTESNFKSLAISKLKSDFNYLIQDVGSGYSVASVQNDPNIALAEKRLINRCKAISRGVEAKKLQKQIEEKQKVDKEMIERRAHFNKTVEKIRSALITCIPNVDNGNNHAQYINQRNECFLIPSQVTLNESNIINWHSNKKISKPRSTVIDFNVNKISKCSIPINDDNKENEPNVSEFSKLETDIKNYETLVTELNKLAADEKKIRNNLSTYNPKDDLSMPRKNNIPFVKQKKNKHDEKTTIKVKYPESNEEQHPITNKIFDESNSSSSVYISSSASTSTNYEDHFESTSKKTIHFENELDKNMNKQSTSELNYGKILSPKKKSLKDVNNIVQRIKNKKQLLVKELVAHSKVDAEKSKVVSSFPNTSPTRKKCVVSNVLPKERLINCTKPSKLKTIPKNSTISKRCLSSNDLSKENPLNCVKLIKTPSKATRCSACNNSGKNNPIDCAKLTKVKTITSQIPERCTAGNDLHKEIPKNYAKLPDSFYNNELKTLKEQISKNKSNNTSCNMKLMNYINELLKMTHSDIDNLSVSSCSSIKLDESILQHSNTNLQYNNELLNCISKCLNFDISELSQDITFDSPKNINLLDKLQELTNYHLEKTHEMNNICNEQPQSLNRSNTKTDTAVNQENNSMNASSNSSVDGEYIWRHLNTLLQSKGLIKSDKEWPMFENLSNSDDDNRSLTDQLLDIYPHKLNDN